MYKTPSIFVIHHDTRLQYAGLFLLKEIVEKDYIFCLDPDDDEHVLEPILSSLMEASYLKINKNHEYRITKRGVEHVHSFLMRYASFTDEYDVYSGVDLKTKDFAIRYYDTFQEEPEWFAFLREERWEDLRIAIAEYQGFDAVEITFMRFINDERFGRVKDRWHYERLLGGVWDEIQAVCNNAVRLQSLELKEQSSEEFLEDILDRGRRLLVELSE